jgi:hypothetical protein
VRGTPLCRRAGAWRDCSGGVEAAAESLAWKRERRLSPRLLRVRLGLVRLDGWTQQRFGRLRLGFRLWFERGCVSSSEGTAILGSRGSALAPPFSESDDTSDPADFDSNGVPSTCGVSVCGGSNGGASLGGTISTLIASGGTGCSAPAPKTSRPSSKTPT